MKVAIFGASGLVGRSLRNILDQNDIPWIGTYNKMPFEGGVQLPATNTNAVQEFFKLHSVTHCINCVAERNVDLCEKQWETTLETNCWFAKRLAEASVKANIYFLHVSTDYVFDGSASPYYPDSEKYPIQSYGKSKAKAEDEIRFVNPDSCIVRVPVLYTHRYNTIMETAVTMIGKKVMDRTRKYTEDDYYIRRPVFIDDMSAFLLSCLQKASKGIYHFYNTSDKTTKYKMALTIANYLETDASHISPQGITTNTAGRPYDTQLLDLQYDRSLFPDTRLAHGITKCFERFKHPAFVCKEPPSSSIFFMIDLDGTLVDTEYLHYKAYKDAFGRYGYDFCDWTDYQELESLEEYCKEQLGERYGDVKRSKQDIFQTYEIDFMPGAEAFLNWLLKHNQNFVVVTNTNKETVEFYKRTLPLLQHITQWVTREDVSLPKPNPEPYILAKQHYWKGESYCIGFENTRSGYTSLADVTSIIYIICNYDSYTHRALYHKDVYFIPDLTEIWKKNMDAL